MSRIVNWAFLRPGHEGNAVTDDDLTSPLGQNPTKARPGRRKAIIAAAILAGIGFVGGSATFAVFPSFDVASREPQAGKGAAQETDQFPAAEAAAAQAWKASIVSREQPPDPLLAPAGPGTEEIANLGGVKIVRAGSQGTSQPLVIDVAKELNRGSASAADPR
ncbi:MAG: hypothetical protein J2P49_06860, partial [Methylocapsa sp.]|nr:hypothetical protein [Methylocapsa sp.]